VREVDFYLSKRNQQQTWGSLSQARSPTAVILLQIVANMISYDKECLIIIFKSSKWFSNDLVAIKVRKIIKFDFIKKGIFNDNLQSNDYSLLFAISPV